jgi:lysine 2,3-aminomutase
MLFTGSFMEDWQKSLQASITTPEQLAEHFPVDAAALKAVVERYPMRITPHYFGLIREPGDPIWRQCVPDVRELTDLEQPEDPLAEENLSPVSAVVHRYPDRALFLVSGTCASYCRFCTRKRKVGCSSMRITMGDVRDGIDYIARNSQIRDVLLSGGDPLLMSDFLLQDILERLGRIPHLEIVRIGTRVPVTLPERITEKLCALLRRAHPLYLNTHFNHPRELTQEAAEACGRLADVGIPLGNQTVLLKGVNDDPEVMAELFRGLLRIRVRPYYLHHMDLTRGTGHFRTSVKTGIGILEALRGTVSGLAIPHYVIDLPGGKGKVPVGPEYVETLGDEVVVRTPRGEQVRFPEVR